MLLWARGVMRAEENGFDITKWNKNPVRHIQQILRVHMPITLQGKGCENLYGLG